MQCVGNLGVLTVNQGCQLAFKAHSYLLHYYDHSCSSQVEGGRDRDPFCSDMETEVWGAHLLG